ncbi:hypothetical protein DSO57_1022326 [Entomophthora muscae]|uniref:Uncharacterized protein n=1 Tax=Entomophthora muscae TaxID=34485 RepID=A0ACC2SG01_9FUNG|nr:hypothetical protein DSO57_1022326 [Entomophthora muscae]
MTSSLHYQGSNLLGAPKNAAPHVETLVLPPGSSSIMIQTTSPDFWGQTPYSPYYAGDSPTQILHLLTNLPGQAQDLLVTDKNLVKSLTSDSLELFFPDSDLINLPEMDPSMPSSPWRVIIPPTRKIWSPWRISPGAPGLLYAMVLMDLSTYFPHLSPMSS